MLLFALFLSSFVDLAPVPILPPFLLSDESALAAGVRQMGRSRTAALPPLVFSCPLLPPFTACGWTLRQRERDIGVRFLQYFLVLLSNDT